MLTVIEEVSHQQMETKTNGEFYAESGARGTPKIHNRSQSSQFSTLIYRLFQKKRICVS